MRLSVSEYAQKKALSRRRVLQLINAGDIKAERIGNQWIISASQLAHEPRIARPFSPRIARAFISHLSKLQPDVEINNLEKQRIQRYLKQLLKSDDPANYLRAWLKNRANSMDFKVAESDISKLYSEDLIVPSGVSAEISGISDPKYFEGYVKQSDLKLLKRKYLLIESEEPNVRLHAINDLPKNQLVLGYILSDLSDNYGPRERNRVKELLVDLWN